MDDFEKELRLGFLEEAGQLLVEAEQCYLSLEENPNNTPILEKIFRIAHNLKGSSKVVGLDSLGAFMHEFETFLLKFKNKQFPINPLSISIFLRCNDHIKLCLESVKKDQTVDNEPVIREIQSFSIPVEKIISPPPPVELKPKETLVPVSHLESAVAVNHIDSSIHKIFQEQERKTEEVSNQVIQLKEKIQVPEVNPVSPIKQDEEFEKMANLTREAVRKVPDIKLGAPIHPTAAHAATGDESIRVSLSRLEKLLNFVGELVIYQSVLKEQAYNNLKTETLKRTIDQIGKVTKEVQDLSMSLRMVPLKQTFQKMQRIVRDTSGMLNKKVQLFLEGEETEVDKTVLEALGDPLVHLIRNAVDHGIEFPEERLAAGKSESGSITLKAYHQSGKLVIEVRDDGNGISPQKLLQKAHDKGILQPGQVLSDKDAIQLIFHPGFSTKSQVTEVSGRGVGMDVVKTNIEQMQGEVLVDTLIEKGSTFKVVLPLTMAIIDGMIVRSGNDRFVIPLTHVHESLKPAPKDISFVTGMGNVLYLRGENLPIVRLSYILGFHNRANSVTNEQIAIIVRTHERPFAVLVDDIIGQFQVVVKKLGAEVQHLRNFSGSAILGDGKPALILEIGEFMIPEDSPVSLLQQRQVS